MPPISDLLLVALLFRLARISHSPSPPPLSGKLDVGGGVGKGRLLVLRSKYLPGAESPSQYSSIVAIRSGEILKDINQLHPEHTPITFQSRSDHAPITPRSRPDCTPITPRSRPD